MILGEIIKNIDLGTYGTIIVENLSNNIFSFIVFYILKISNKIK